MASDADPFIVEFLVNFRWMLHYVVQRLDPLWELQYPQLLADVLAMDAVLSSSSFATVRTLGAAPFGALEMAKCGFTYLLVAEAVLGQAPPTMHPFLIKAARRQAEVTAVGGAGSGEGRHRGIDETATAAAVAELNTSDGTSTSTAATMTTSVDARTVDTVDDADISRVQTASEDQIQAFGMLLRWLLRAGVIPAEELALTLSLIDESGVSSGNGDGLFSNGGDGEAASRSRRTSSGPTSSLFTSEDGSHSGSSAGAGSQRRTYRVSYRRAAKRLCLLCPFYLGAHLLLSRCLLMHHACTMLPVQCVAVHIETLESAAAAAAAAVAAAGHPVSGGSGSGRSAVAALSFTAQGGHNSLEAALASWLRCVANQVRDSHDSAADTLANGMNRSLNSNRQNVSVASAASHSARSRRRRVLGEEAALGSREWRFWFAQLRLKADLYELTADGLALGLACHYYEPNALPLNALHPPAFLASGSSAPAPVAAATRATARNWAAVLRCAEGLGLTPCVTADEFAQHGAQALQLHLLRFTQELFALLATGAEEQVRESLELELEEEALAGSGGDVAAATSADDDNDSALSPVEDTQIMQEDEAERAKSGGHFAGKASLDEQEHEVLPLRSHRRVTPDKARGPIVAKKKAATPTPIRSQADTSADHDQDTDEFPSPPKVFETEAELPRVKPATPSPLAAGGRGERGGIMRDDDVPSQPASKHSPGKPEEKVVEQFQGGRSPEVMATTPPAKRRIQVYPESPKPLSALSTPRPNDALPVPSTTEGTPRPPKQSTFSTSANLVPPPPLSEGDGATWHLQPLFTSSSPTPGLLVSKTTVDVQSRVLQGTDQRLSGDRVVNDDNDDLVHSHDSRRDASSASSSSSYSASASPSSALSSFHQERDGQPGVSQPARVSAPSTVEAASANTSADVAEDQRVAETGTPQEGAGSDVAEAAQGDPEAQLMALLAEQEVHAGQLPVSRVKYSITSSMSIPVDVLDSRGDEHDTQGGTGTADREEAVVETGNSDRVAAVTESNTAANNDQQDPGLVLDDRESRDDSFEVKQQPSPSAANCGGPHIATDTVAATAVDNSLSAPSPQPTDDVGASVADSAAPVRASVAIRKWKTESSSSSSGSSSSSSDGGSDEMTADASPRNLLDPEETSTSSSSASVSRRSSASPTTSAEATPARPLKEQPAAQKTSETEWSKTSALSSTPNSAKQHGKGCEATSPPACRPSAAVREYGGVSSHSRDTSQRRPRLSSSGERGHTQSRSPQTPECATTAPSPLAVCDSAERDVSSVLPVEGSPVPSMMMSTGSPIHGEADSYLSSVASADAHARANSPPTAETELDVLLSHLLSETPASELTEADTKLLLHTVARQQEVIRRLAQQLAPTRGSASKSRKSGSASADKGTPTSRLFASNVSDGGRSRTSHAVCPEPPVLPSVLFDVKENAAAEAWHPSVADSPDPLRMRRKHGTHAAAAPYSASLIDGLCAAFEAEDGTIRERGAATASRTLPMDTTVESILTDGTGEVDTSRASLQAQLAETDVTAASSVGGR